MPGMHGSVENGTVGRAPAVECATYPRFRHFSGQGASSVGFSLGEIAHIMEIDTDFNVAPSSLASLLAQADHRYEVSDDGSLTASLVSGPSHGTLTLNANGTS